MPKTPEEFKKMLTKEERDKAIQERVKSAKEKRYIELVGLFKHRALTTGEIAHELGVSYSSAFCMLSQSEKDKMISRRYDKDTLMAYWIPTEEVS